MSDAWLIIAIFGFAFILWLSTGGPDRPISFAGPYLTPIATIGDVAEDETVGESDAGDGSPPGGTVSPYRGQVRIIDGPDRHSALDEDREHVTIQAAREATGVNVTGWQLVGVETGIRITIPQAAAIAAQPGAVDVVLHLSDKAIIASGHSPLGESFRENACVEELIEDGDSSGNRAEYADCVRARVHDEGFYGNTWHIYLGRSAGLWRADGETIRLLDRAGRTVDVYAY